MQKTRLLIQNSSLHRKQVHHNRTHPCSKQGSSYRIHPDTKNKVHHSGFIHTETRFIITGLISTVNKAVKQGCSYTSHPYTEKQGSSYRIHPSIKRRSSCRIHSYKKTTTKNRGCALSSLHYLQTLRRDEMFLAASYILVVEIARQWGRIG